MNGKGSLKVISHAWHRELHLQLIPESGESPAAFAERLAGILHAHGAALIRATFFGKLAEKENVLAGIGNRLGALDFPCTWIEGSNCSGAFINGVYMIAITGPEVRRFHADEQVAGSYFRTGEADFCYLGNLCPDPGLPAPEQTLEVLKAADGILKQAGLSYDDTVRTWFYLDDILEWYGDFNRARTSFYRRHGIFDKLVPASTGIGGQNPRGSKVCLELTAIKPRNVRFLIERVASPMQCSAEDYGSAFSRAVWYSDGEYETLTVSGTASINRDGKTMHPGDPGKQIDLSFSVIRAILESRNFSFRDVVRAYAYCSDRAYMSLFTGYMESLIPDKFTCILASNKICREDLMFEIEVDVIKRKSLKSIK
jgi:enamine deaminase RidA (YjgF/YER057c/UK114 family)